MALTHIQRGFLYIAVNSCGTKLAVMSALALARILLVNGAPLLPNIEFQCVSSQENIQRDTLYNSASSTYTYIDYMLIYFSGNIKSRTWPNFNKFKLGRPDLNMCEGLIKQ